VEIPSPTFYLLVSHRVQTLVANTLLQLVVFWLGQRVHLVHAVVATCRPRIVVFAIVLLHLLIRTLGTCLPNVVHLIVAEENISIPLVVVINCQVQELLAPAGRFARDRLQNMRKYELVSMSLKSHYFN